MAETKKGGNPSYDCVQDVFHGKSSESYSEPYVIILGLTHEIATGVICHNMSHILTYFAYFRKSWSRPLMNISFDFVRLSHILTDYHISSHIFYLSVRFSAF